MFSFFLRFLFASLQDTKTPAVVVCCCSRFGLCSSFCFAFVIVLHIIVAVVHVSLVFLCLPWFCFGRHLFWLAGDTPKQQFSPRYQRVFPFFFFFSPTTPFFKIFHFHFCLLVFWRLVLLVFFLRPLFSSSSSIFLLGISPLFVLNLLSFLFSIFSHSFLLCPPLFSVILPCFFIGFSFFLSFLEEKHAML